MANTYAPSGFTTAALYGAVAPNYATRTATIAYNYGTQIAFGDPVYLNTSGDIVLYAAAGTTIHGIFRGCKYLDPSSGRTQWYRYWSAPTLPSTTVVEAYVEADPTMTFQVQTSGSALTQADIGKNADIVTSSSGAPNAAGTSTCGLSVASIADTATLPFRIVGIVQSPAINFLYTPGTGNDWAIVTMNTSDITTRTGQA